MSTLRISLFGDVQISHSPEAETIRVTPSVRSLLAYLLLKRDQCHSRQHLSGLFWGDYDEARAQNCLRTALWRLRQILEPEGTPAGAYLLTTPSYEIGFNCEGNYWLDVQKFEESITQALSKPEHSWDSADVARLEQALKLYKGRLLTGCYEDWIVSEQERLENLYLHVLYHLMIYYRRHQAYDQGIECGQSILRHDTLRENIHRELMHLYSLSGQRTLALRQYEACQDVLAEELGVFPMEETRQLYLKILVESGSRLLNEPIPTTKKISTPETAANPPETMQEAVFQLERTLALAHDIQSQLHHAVYNIRTLLGNRKT